MRSMVRASKRLLLINPAHETSFWGFEYSMDLWDGVYSNAPLAVLTVAALTPEDWQVEVVDENVSEVDLDATCDVVGITAMNVQAARAFVLADAFRKRGRTVVLGGPFPSLEPDRCAAHADTVVEGEAERTWPAFCRDFEQGEHRPRYTETGAVDLAQSPIPRFDLVRAKDYACLPVQTSRGCPHSCEFCDVIVLNGRRVRTKPAEQVMAEVQAVLRAGGDSVFFTDDNFVGNLKVVRRLLTDLAHLRESLSKDLYFFTQTSVDLAEHPDILSLMTRAGFTRVFLGIETPRQASLREAGKRQNIRGDLLQKIHRIQAAGLITWAGMIVGFDHDDEKIFAEQADFLAAAGIPIAMVGMLNAPPKTRLFQRLQAEGRIAPCADWADNCASTNIIPMQMTRAQLLEGYAGLLTDLYRQENYAQRLMDNIMRMDSVIAGQSTAGSRFPSATEVLALWNAISAFTFSRDPRRRRHFLPNLLRIILHRRERMVEGAIHLAMWRHFETYVPQLTEKLQATARAEAETIAMALPANRGRAQISTVIS